MTKQYYDLRAAEKLLGIAKHTARHVARRHPLPKPAIYAGVTPCWTREQIEKWYATRPTHGGDRRSKKFKAKRQKATNNEAPKAT